MDKTNEENCLAGGSGELQESMRHPWPWVSFSRLPESELNSHLQRMLNMHIDKLDDDDKQQIIDLLWSAAQPRPEGIEMVPISPHVQKAIQEALARKSGA